MGLLDKLNSLADRMRIHSEAYAPGEQQYNEQQQEAYDQSYAYAQESAYDDSYPVAAPDEEVYYEQSYSSGDGTFTSAGARPVSREGTRRKGKSILGNIWDRVRSSRQTSYEEDYDVTSGAEPPETPPDNVIHIHGGSGRTDPGSGRQWTDTADPYDDEEESETAAYQSVREAATMIFLVRRLQDAEEIIAHMLDGGNVIINMEEIDELLKQRVLDMISGAAFSLDCTIKPISVRNYLVAPSGEKIYTNISSRDREPPDPTRRAPRDRRY